jgi:hypothetical protein
MRSKSWRKADEGGPHTVQSMTNGTGPIALPQPEWVTLDPSVSDLPCCSEGAGAQYRVLLGLMDMTDSGRFEERRNRQLREAPASTAS